MLKAAGTVRTRRISGVVVAMQSLQDRAGTSLGPISLSFSDGGETDTDLTDDELNRLVREDRERGALKSINTMSTAEWRAKYEKDGEVDLWVEEEFNSGSRVIVRRLSWMAITLADDMTSVVAASSQDISGSMHMQSASMLATSCTSPCSVSCFRPTT
jgi:hypothetical protein